METREKHDSHITALYEIIGTHFVDVFFNHVHAGACKLVESARARSRTTAFQDSVNGYVTEIQRNGESYKRTVQLLHTYVRQHTSAHRMTDYSSFVDKVVNTLVPDAYFRTMHPKDKDEVLGTAVCDLVAGLGVYATTPEMLPRIIDHRENSAVTNTTIAMIQDHAVTLLFTTRDRLFNAFLGQSTKAKAGVSTDLVVKLKGAIRKLAKEKAELAEALRAAEQEAEEYKNKYKSKKRDLSLAEAEKAQLLSRLGSIQQVHAMAAPAGVPTGTPAAEPSVSIRPRTYNPPPAPALSEDTDTIDPLAFLNTKKAAAEPAAPPSGTSLNSLIVGQDGPGDRAASSNHIPDEMSGEFSLH